MRFPIKLFVCLSLFTLFGFSQKTIDQAIEKYNTGSIDYIGVDTLKEKLDAGQDWVLLDTRAKAEYEVSHLKNAIWVGYKAFDKSKIEHLDKSKTVIVYCSIGVRSEQIGEKLQALGFENIKNLYGGIFEWVNEGYPVFLKGLQTQKIHAFNKSWSKSLKRGQKVF